MNFNFFLLAKYFLCARLYRLFFLMLYWLDMRCSIQTYLKSFELKRSSFLFPLYDQFNKTGRGSECSQAIMLVTDGAVDTYDAIFAKYNWPDRKVMLNPHLMLFPKCSQVSWPGFQMKLNSQFFVYTLKEKKKREIDLFPHLTFFD